jgi:hypothetical protein
MEALEISPSSYPLSVFRLSIKRGKNCVDEGERLRKEKRVSQGRM